MTLTAQDITDLTGLRHDLHRHPEVSGGEAHIPFGPTNGPMRASEDFGRFAGSGARSVMFLLGSGTACPALHDPGYDFPDSLIAPGVSGFAAVLTAILT